MIEYAHSQVGKPGWPKEVRDLYVFSPETCEFTEQAKEAIIKQYGKLDPPLIGTIHENLSQLVESGAADFKFAGGDIRNLYKFKSGTSDFTPEALRAMEKAFGLDGKKTQLLLSGGAGAEAKAPGRLMLSTTGQRTVAGQVVMTEVKDSVVDTPGGKQYNGLAAMYHISKVVSDSLKTDASPLTAAVELEAKNAERVPIANVKTVAPAMISDATAKSFVNAVNDIKLHAIKQIPAEYRNEAIAEKTWETIQSYVIGMDAKELQRMSIQVEFSPNAEKTCVEFHQFNKENQTTQPIQKTDKGFIDASGRPLKAFDRSGKPLNNNIVMTIHLPVSLLNEPDKLGKEIYQVLIEHSSPGKLTVGQKAGIQSWLDKAIPAKADASPAIPDVAASTGKATEVATTEPVVSKLPPKVDAVRLASISDKGITFEEGGEKSELTYVDLWGKKIEQLKERLEKAEKKTGNEREVQREIEDLKGKITAAEAFQQRLASGDQAALDQARRRVTEYRDAMEKYTARHGGPHFRGRAVAITQLLRYLH